MDKQHLFSLSIVLLVFALGLRTYVEVGKYRAEKRRTSLHGLEELQIKVHPLGDPVHVRVLTRANQTGHEYFEVEELITRTSSGFLRGQPGSFPPHALRAQNRTLTVVEGTLEYEVYDGSGQVLRAGPGDTVFIPHGQPVSWWLAPGPSHVEGSQKLEELQADAPERVVVRVLVQPAGPLGEASYEALAGFTVDQGSLATTDYLQTIIWAARQSMDFIILPGPLRLACRFVGAPLAHVLGYEATYKKYTTTGKLPPLLQA